MLYKISLKAFICDTPVRSFLKCTKGHNGYYCCERCISTGVHKGRIVFNTVGQNQSLLLWRYPPAVIISISCNSFSRCIQLLLGLYAPCMLGGGLSDNLILERSRKSTIQIVPKSIGSYIITTDWIKQWGHAQWICPSASLTWLIGLLKS